MLRPYGSFLSAASRCASVVVFLLASGFQPIHSLFIAPPRLIEVQADTAEDLRLGFGDQPHWTNGCLQLSIHWSNSSSSNIFLAQQDLSIEISVAEVDEGTRKQLGSKWILAYGSSDVFIVGARILAPGAVLHKEVCVSKWLTVTSLEEKSHRAIPVRGTLRIRVPYFRTEQEYQDYRIQVVGRTNDPNQGGGKLLQPKFAMITAAIPCHDEIPQKDCTSAPTVLRSEDHWMPDVYDLPDWNQRGQRITSHLVGSLSKRDTP